MITLHTFGPAFGLPDPSPFCTKAMLLLRLAGLPFERVDGNLRRAPKGKLPILVDDGVTIADSTFIRMHLERKHGIDFDKGLSAEQRGIGWAVEKMLEEQLYWIMVHERWVDAANFARGPAQFFQEVPAPLRPLIVSLVKRKVSRNLDGQGIGRHSASERLELARRTVESVAAILGERRYLFGDTPSGADATLGAFMITGLCQLFDSPVRGVIEGHPTLVSYAARIGQALLLGPSAVKTAA